MIKIKYEPAFLRNEYLLTKENEFSIVQRQKIPKIQKMISCVDTRSQDERAKKIAYLVHFFKEDDCFEFLYNDPTGQREHKAMKRYAQYAAVCSPDFSIYPQMPLCTQRAQIQKGRWCAARWQQDYGLKVVPTVSWADKRSLGFCFEGLPNHATLAVSTVGAWNNKKEFMNGYTRMLEVLEPELIFCYGKPFAEMDGNVIAYPYEVFCKVEGI